MRNAARNAYNQIVTDLTTDISNRIIEDDITNADQIRIAAGQVARDQWSRGKLPPDRNQVFERTALPHPVFDPGVVEAIRAMIKNYDGMQDGTLTKFNATHDQITPKRPDTSRVS